MAKKALKKGIFITFEGCEGCGKSTQAALLYRYLKKKGHRCIYTREPGGTKVGEAIRKILLNSKGLNISSLTELLLFEAARSELIKEIVLPALKRKTIVISDRSSDATFAYQGYGGGLDLKAIEMVDKVATGGLVPDLTILLDIEESLGLRRAGKNKVDRMEGKPLSYHSKVRRGYLSLAKANPGRIKVIETAGTVNKTQISVREEVETVLQKYTRTR